jgi:hypothetical protein
MLSLASPCSLVFKSFICCIKDAEKGNFHSHSLLLVITARGLFFYATMLLGREQNVL